MFDQSKLMSEDELIKYLEMEFDYDDKKAALSQTKQSSDKSKSTDPTYYKELIDKFKSDFLSVCLNLSLRKLLETCSSISVNSSGSIYVIL